MKLYLVHAKGDDGAVGYLTKRVNSRWDELEATFENPEECPADKVIQYLNDDAENANYHDEVGAYDVLAEIMTQVGVSSEQQRQIFWHLAAAGGFRELRDYQVSQV